jgi:hypothetical protein
VPPDMRPMDASNLLWQMCGKFFPVRLQFGLLLRCLVSLTQSWPPPIRHRVSQQLLMSLVPARKYSPSGWRVYGCAKHRGLWRGSCDGCRVLLRVTG